MKVLLINGSPHARGCTATALGVVAEVLEQNGIETEMIHGLPETEPTRIATNFIR